MKKGVSASFRRIAILLLFFAILLGAMVSTAQAAPAESTSYGVYHTVRYGETLSHIAYNYGVTVHDLLVANPHIVNPNLIYYGTVIFIPYHHAPPPAPAPQHYCRYYHTVSYGENLINLGIWYGRSPYAIAEANGIYNLNHIYAGQSLCIP